MVGQVGVEPTHSFELGILSPTRLPIPPLPQLGGHISRKVLVGKKEMQKFSNLFHAVHLERSLLLEGTNVIACFHHKVKRFQAFCPTVLIPPHRQVETANFLCD